MTLAPKMDPAFECHHVALDLDVYPVGFYLGIALDVAFGDGAYTFEAPERLKILEVNQQSGRQPRGVQNANFGPR